MQPASGGWSVIDLSRSDLSFTCLLGEGEARRRPVIDTVIITVSE